MAFLLCSQAHRRCTGTAAKAAGSQNKPLAPNCSNSHCNLHRHTFSVEKVPVPLKNICNEAVDKKDYTSGLKCTFLNILCDKREVCMKCSSYTPKYEGYFRKRTCVIEYSVNVAFFFACKICYCSLKGFRVWF